ncbi:hypothetical protein KC980_00890 [candidate division WWE3 bacterium]|uniref:Uncharacterized protein n=1 Tax=candidate division WWE3 bacterium TaxID=2053526 RepID=A0A955J1G6_UNCKA|nr:hypothetical protein [candidate division WWE3 bacterium]
MDTIHKLPKTQSTSHSYRAYTYLLLALFFSGLTFALLRFYMTLPANTLDVAETGDVIVNKSVTVEGRIAYVDPRIYPQDNVSFILVDSSNKLMHLLKDSSRRLEISEGLWAQVTGSISPAKDGKNELLTVERVVFRSSSSSGSQSN